MVGFLWLKSKAKLKMLVLIVCCVPVMVMYMPEHWTNRMSTIDEYEEDASAQGRINAWLMAWNLVKDRPIVGGGFDMYSDYTFGRWAPNPTDIHSSHSNYFQMLGEHGWPGLILFLTLLLLSWRMASEVIGKVRSRPDLQWAGNLCRMMQVSLIGYCVGGAFVNLAYFDLIYFYITLIVGCRFYVQREISTDPQGVRAKKPVSRSGSGGVRGEDEKSRPAIVAGPRFVPPRHRTR